MTEPHEVFAELCRQAARLSRAGAASLSGLRVSYGDISLDLTWTAQPGEPPPPGDAEEAEDGSWRVHAPMVGTFYHAPQPGAEPFVREGDAVAAGQQVGVIEAMKLMNAVTAERAGVVTEILVPDATPVEYGRPLIVLRPDE
ncbi:hypothetical protein GCM10009850_003840 [Nonomuraea monospora]|uniref:Biotin carboxyl carrier protein of acetyl-CoA carboxylase n=1 Tax=Nonomuraea monospora TaxID=568818 RepID=A0ABN3C5B0_9ACTN